MSTNNGSQADFAKKYGYSKAAVTQFKNNGRMVFDSNGKVDFDASIRKIKETADPARFDVTERHAKARESEYNTLDRSENRDNGSYQAARTVREKYLALQAKLDYELSLGELVEKSVVEKILFERARQFRDGVTATSKRIAPLVIGKESLKEIESLIDAELTYMLDQFSKLPVIE